MASEPRDRKRAPSPSAGHVPAECPAPDWRAGPPAFLGEHVVGGAVIVPGASHVAMLLGACGAAPAALADIERKKASH